MRILHLLIGSQDGGAESFFMRLGAALHARGVEELMVMSPHAGRQNFFERHGTPYRCIDFERWGGFSGKWQLRQTIREFQPDIIIAWMNRAARRLPKRCDAVKIGRLGGPYGIKHYHKCDYMVVNSEPLREHVQKQGQQQVECIANFIMTTIPDAPEPAQHSRPQLFFHGRLHEQKGLDVLIDAMPQIDADLHIIGDGVEKNALLAQAQEQGVSDKIHFHGWQSDVSVELAAADIYVFPSRYEGTSNSLLEAMAHGKPIVTTNGDSVSWFLTHEENALIVDVDNAAQLAEAVNRLIASPELARQLGENGRALYQSRFNEEAICRQWLDFCTKALHKRRANG